MNDTKLETERQKLYRAAISCEHLIDSESVALYRDSELPGNALLQLADRLESCEASRTATLRARIAELEAIVSAPRGTDAQILKERSLTCDAALGAIMFGGNGSEPPPDDAAWLRPFYNMGQRLTELESMLSAVGAGGVGQPVKPQAEPPQQLAAKLHAYEEIAEHYAKCAISPEALRDWVAERMDKTEHAARYMRDQFESFWNREMNTVEMDLYRCEFSGVAKEAQPYACHETQRSWLAWQAAMDATQPTQDADSRETEPKERLIELAMMALLQCSASDLESYAPDMYANYREDVCRVIATIQAKGGA